MAENDERRKFPRTEINWPVNILVDDEIVEGETIDVSADGVHVNCDDPVPMNESVTMTIAPPDRDLIRVNVKVVWSDLDGIDMENRAVGMGLCFVEISDDNRKAFDEALADYLG